MAIPTSFIQELLARADIVDIVGRHVQLKKGGANFMGLCPFHGEKSPSFSVSPTKQFYHCFGCGVSGDAIKFMTEYGGMTFIEAVKDLSQQYGLQVPEDDVSPQDRARAAQMREQQATLTSVLEKAGAAYIKALRNSERAIDYFKGRGVSGEVAKTFGLGYAPEGWRSLASVFPDYNDPLLVESGLVITGEPGEENAAGEAKRYDRFRDRVMFPIRNVKGECIGFGGR
ncbi:MAG: CHC2 zinc finger domain-containing protein, partial [Polaromonas sp.]